jgi:hypothetical protein
VSCVGFAEAPTRSADRAGTEPTHPSRDSRTRHPAPQR